MSEHMCGHLLMPVNAHEQMNATIACCRHRSVSQSVLLHLSHTNFVFFRVLAQSSSGARTTADPATDPEPTPIQHACPPHRCATIRIAAPRALRADGRLGRIRFAFLSAIRRSENGSPNVVDDGRCPLVTTQFGPT